MEQTLVVLKPDTVARGIAGEIISRFEKVGLKITNLWESMSKKKWAQTMLMKLV